MYYYYYICAYDFTETALGKKSSVTMDLDSLSLKYHEPNGTQGISSLPQKGGAKGLNPLYADPPFDPETGGIARWCNRGGVLAFRRPAEAGSLVQAVRTGFAAERRGPDEKEGSARLKGQV